MGSVEFAASVQQHEWFYEENAEETANLERTVQEVQGILYQLRRPENARLALQTMPVLFVERRHSNDEAKCTLSPQGHKTVADDIRSVVDE